MNCANSFRFYVYLMLHACAARFDVTGNFEKFCELNKALVLYACVTRFDVTENFENFLDFGGN